MTKEIIIVRIFHGLAAFYFIACLLDIYITAVTKNINLLFFIALASLILEGFVVFILNKGDCPLIFVQRKINDPVPFFNLFLPKNIAKKAIPFFSALTIVGLFLLAIRFLL